MKQYRNLRTLIACIMMLALCSCKPGADDDNVITVNLHIGQENILGIHLYHHA